MADSARSLHQALLAEGRDTHVMALQLVQAMGGIDYILSDYLSQTDLLNEHQFLEIKELLSNHQKDVESSRQKAPVLMFEPDNNFSNAWFGSNIGPKVNQILFHKITMTVACLLLSTVFFETLLPYQRVINSLEIVRDSSLFIWTSLLMLSANRKATKLLLRVFEYWFKICYVLMTAIASIIVVSRKHPQQFGLQCIAELAKVSGIALFSAID